MLLSDVFFLFEGIRILNAFRYALAMCARKHDTLQSLEMAMGSKLVMKLTEESKHLNGTHYRPRIIESPSRMAILKTIQEEEVAEDRSSFANPQHPPHHSRSVKLSRSVGINMGLDIEMRQ